MVVFWVRPSQPLTEQLEQGALGTESLLKTIHKGLIGGVVHDLTDRVWSCCDLSKNQPNQFLASVDPELGAPRAAPAVPTIPPPPAVPRNSERPVGAYLEPLPEWHT